jgi:Ca-activated chloride channel homolog
MEKTSSHDMMTIIEAAQAADVLVYMIRYTEKEHGELTASNKYGIQVMDRIAKDTGGVHIDAELTYLNPSIAQLLKQPACAALV